MTDDDDDDHSLTSSAEAAVVVVVSMNNLAVVLLDRGKAQDAGDLFQGALLLLQSLHNGGGHGFSSDANALLQKGMEVFRRCKSSESTIPTQTRNDGGSEFARAITLPSAPAAAVGCGPSFHTSNNDTHGGNNDTNASVTNLFPCEETSSCPCQLEVAILIFNIAFSVYSREGNTDAELDLTHSLYTLSYNALSVLFQGGSDAPPINFLANDNEDDNDAFVTKMSELLMSLLWNMGKLCLETNRFAEAKEHYTALATFLHHASATDPPTDSPNTRTNHSTTTTETTTTATTDDPSDAGNQLDHDARKLLINAILLAAVHEPEAATAA